jgi:Prokaryotic E2 family E
VSALEVLQRHTDELESETGLRVRLIEAGVQILVILEKVPLPSGAYRVGHSDVLFVTDAQYPLSAMDMFWTEIGVLRADGSIPVGGDSIEMYGGRQWRRFSWHRNGVWDPSRNGLLDHFEFMQARFAEDAPR